MRVSCRVLSKVDKQRLGAGLGAVLGVKQGCGSIQAKIRWLGVWCGGCKATKQGLGAWLGAGAVRVLNENANSLQVVKTTKYLAVY